MGSFYEPVLLENEKTDFETFFNSMQEVYPDVTKSEASAFLKFGAPETDDTCQVSFYDGYFYYNTSSDDDGWTFMGDIRDFLNHAASRICDLLEYDDGDGVSIAAFLDRHPDAFMPSLRDSLDKVLNENTYNQDGVSLDYAFPEYNDDSRIREELGLADAEPLTVYEEPRWHFRDTDKALEIIKTASPDLYNEIIEFRNSLSEEDKKTLYIDFGLSIRYDDGELDGTDWHSKCPSADDMFADGFIVRYNARDNDGNVPNPAEGIDLSERIGLPWRNRFLDMAREHIQKNIDAYGEFIKLRDEAIGNQLSSPSMEPSITEAGPSVDDTGIRHFTVTYPRLTAELGNLLNLDHSVPGHPDCTANYGISQSFAVSERDGSIISKGTIMLTKDYVDESGNGKPVLIYREPFRPGPVSVRRLIEDWAEGAIRKEFPGPDKVREPATPSFVELGVWLKENIPEENSASFRNYVHDFVNEDFNHLDRKALWNASELCKIKADWLENREGEQANLHDATPGDISAFLSKNGNSRFFSESLMNEVLRISDEEAVLMLMSDDGRLFIASDGYHKMTPEELYEAILLKFDSILSGGIGTLSEEERIEYENYRKEFIDKYAEATVSVNEGPIDALLNLPSSERDPVTVFTTCLKANVSSGLSLLDAGKAAVGTCRNVFDEKQMDKLQLFLSRNIDVLDDKHFNSFFDDIISGRFVPERKLSGSVKNRNYEGIDR